MPRRASELQAIEVRRLGDGVHAVGGVAGLVLQVRGNAKSWLLRIRIDGRRRHIGLGSYPGVSLADARSKAAEIRERIRVGSDPLAERKAAIAERRARAAKAVTFMKAAEACHAAKLPEFRNAKHGQQWINTLRQYVPGDVADLPVDHVELAHVMRALDPIWRSKTETASRVRQRIEAVLDFATVRGWRSGDNPARWKGHLEMLLPAARKVSRVTHHRALPVKEAPAFLADLRRRNGMAARALEFAILTAARSGEVRGMVWSEVDLESRVWTVPADRIKAGRVHRVPLSDAAVDLLEGVPRALASDVVFWSTHGRSLSANALTKAAASIADCTVHGFRSVFKDWCRVMTNHADEVSELALAHVSSDATRAAYARDELLEERARLMQAWARWLTGAGQ